MDEHVILIDIADNEIGTMDKLEAHLQAKLHRAFSVFIFNTAGELLLQQRALDKYHSGGKWTNTCCSHPRPGELTEDAASRRLQEEMGLTCELHYLFNFVYKAVLDDGLTEYEYDHVYYGITDVAPTPVPDEAMGFKYMDMQHLEQDIIQNPDEYTEWLKICFDKVKQIHRQIFGQ